MTDPIASPHQTPRRRAARRRLSRARAAAAALALIAALIAAAPARACGVALLLAHDVSASVHWAEYALQTNGHAAAFRDPEVQREILAVGGVTVMLLHWSGAQHQEAVLGWTPLTSVAQIEAFAARLGAAERTVFNQKTALGEMLTAAETLWTGPARDCQRRVIDISGDGVSNTGLTIGPPRRRLIEAGVTINGLAIANMTTPGRDVHYYYERRVIGGPGAFALRAAGFGDYARAFREKLLRELRGPMLAQEDGETRHAAAAAGAAPP